MKKAILVGFLLVFAWTSVVGAQEVQADEGESFIEYLKAQPPYREETIQSTDGNDWILMTDAEKACYLLGFMSGAGAVALYGVENLTAYNVLLVKSFLKSCLTSDGETAYVSWLEAITSNIDDTLDGFNRATDFNFRIGVYMLELNVFYETEANRDIQLIDAVYIANERLNGREVDLTVWRNKGQQQEGT